MSENISNLCYKFIEDNPNYFNLKSPDFSKDHKIAIKKLEDYSKQQTCSSSYFKLMLDIYKKSHYIGPEDFIQYYTSSVKKLHSIGDKKNIILLLPGYKFNPGEPVDFTKSNYYFTLYFMKLYRDVTGENMKNVYPMIIKGGKHVYINELNIDGIINKLRDTTGKESTLVICDDFSYSGEQLSYIIGDVIPVRQNVDLYLVICGMTNTAKGKIESIKSKYNYDNPKLNINIIFPDEGGYFLEKNDFLSVLYEIMLPNKTEGKSRQKMESEVMEYIKENDMYQISKWGDNNLEANKQFINLYHRFTNSLTYPFFKYPDHISTITQMCVVRNYSKDYVFLYKNLDPAIQKKINWHGTRISINKLIPEPHLTFFLDNFGNKAVMAEYLKANPDFNLIEICDANLKLIDLANCDEPKPDAISRNCNTDCWKPFYKIIIEEEPFKEFNSIIDSLVSEPRSGGKKSKKSKKYLDEIIKRSQLPSPSPSSALSKVSTKKRNQKGKKGGKRKSRKTKRKN
jgi:hypothetical protein